MRTFFVALLILTGMSFSVAHADADPDRPIAEFTDKCWNLSGLQLDAHFDYGLVRWKVKTPERGDCRKISQLTITG